MGLYKRAAARGVAYELTRRGICEFPTKEAMDDCADAVADHMGAAPEMSGDEGHSPEQVAEMANQLIAMGKALQANAGEGGKMAALELSKLAAEVDYESVAAAEASILMDKAAAEVRLASSLIEGGDKQNTPGDAAKHDSVAALDQKQRPEGAHHLGMGNTQMDASTGHVGDLKVQPAAPKNSPAGSNSVNEDAKKSAALQAIIEKHANKLVGLHEGKHQNSPAAAAQHDALAKLDQKNRPDGKYHVGQGNANFSEPQAHRVGKEMPHPSAPSNSPAGTNSVIHASKSAAELEQDAFLTLFKKCAEDVGPYLPNVLSDDEKIAAISHMIGFDHAGRQAYLDGLYKKASEMKSEEPKKEEKSEEPKKEEEKSESKGEKYEGMPEALKEKLEGKKESALLAQIRDIASRATL